MFDEYLNAHDLSVLLLPGEARRPFPPRADRKRWEGLPPDARGELLSWGGEALEGYPPLTATQFLAFVRKGDRQAYERPYFERRLKLMGAVLAECVLDDGTYLDAVIDGLWCILEESSWVISAHNGSDHPGVRPARERPLPDVQNPYIDLFAAQTSATLCYALYFLGDKLDAVSPLIGRRVRLEVERRIFLPFLTRDDFWWMGMIRRDVNNWTPWIVGNVMDSMLLLMEDRGRLAEGLARAMRMLDRYLAVMPRDGGCDEGCGYWNMAGAALLDCLESLSLATGGQVDFYGEPLIRAIGAFPLKAHIAGGYYWNFADCDARPEMDGERLYRYGLRTGNRELMALGARTFAERGGVRPLDTPQMNRVLMSLFNAPPPPDEGEAGAAREPERISMPDLQVFAFRRGGFYAAIKGGHNGENHNHNDVGSFLLYLDGEPCVIDAGNLTYTARTFGPERYTLWNTRSRNHNLPLIGGHEQRAGRAYAAREIREAENGAAMELAGAYPPEAGVQSFLRTLAVTEEGAELRDLIRLEAAAPVEWVFMLRKEPERVPGGLRAGGLLMLWKGERTLTVEEIRVTDDRMARGFPGSLWRARLSAAPADAHEETFDFRRCCIHGQCSQE